MSLPSYLCIWAILLCMPTSRLIPSFPPSLYSACCFLGFGKQLQLPVEAQRWWPWQWGVVRVCGLGQNPRSCQWRPRGGGLGSGALSGYVDSVRIHGHFYLVYRQLEQCSHAPSLANVRTDGFNFFLSSLWGRFFLPLHSSGFLSANILWKVWFVSGSLPIFFFFLPFFHIKHIYLSGELELDSQSLQA